MLICGEIGPLTEDQRVFIMKIYESNERMVALINELLEADKLENGTAQFEIQETSLVDLLQNLLEEIRIVGQRHKVEIRTEIDPDIPHIPIDPKSIRSVFQNVIENAIKYSHANSDIRIELRNREHTVEFIVADHGIGIPKDEQKNIFTRFYRSANAVRFVTDSSGLGLYIVATVVKRHNGTIRFESEENVGTTFFITLPKKPQATV
jgi:signal transduction histidine kinase